MTVSEISTHKAVKENGVINIYAKGFTGKELDPKGVKLWEEYHFIKYPEWFTDELLWEIPLENEDDLFAIFENLEENNRINVTEF